MHSTRSRPSAAEVAAASSSSSSEQRLRRRSAYSSEQIPYNQLLAISSAPQREQAHRKKVKKREADKPKQVLADVELRKRSPHSKKADIEPVLSPKLSIEVSHPRGRIICGQSRSRGR